MADDRGFRSQDATLEEISQAAQLLSNLNALNEYAKVHGCKQTSAKLLQLDTVKSSPSILYYKAEIYRMYECATLSGVGKEIEKMLATAE